MKENLIYLKRTIGTQSIYWAYSPISEEPETLSIVISEDPSYPIASIRSNSLSKSIVSMVEQAAEYQPITREEFWTALKQALEAQSRNISKMGFLPDLMQAMANKFKEL